MTTSNKKNRKQKTSPGLKLSGIVLAVVLMFIAGAIFSGCKAKKQLSSETVTTITTTDHLTPVAVPGDSSHMKALFRCDSLNNVLLIGLSEQKSKNMNSNFSFANGVLDYQAKTEPDTVYLKSTDKTITTFQRITITLERKVPVVKEVKVRGFLWWSGLVFWICIAAFILFKIVPKAPILKLINSIFKH